MEHYAFVSWRLAEMMDSYNETTYTLANNLSPTWKYGPEWALRAIGVMPPANMAFHVDRESGAHLG